MSYGERFSTETELQAAALQEYLAVLRKISDNVFVTQETHQKRLELKQFEFGLKNHLLKFAPPENTEFSTHLKGSMGPGKATPSSDYDGHIFLTNPTAEITRLAYDYVLDESNLPLEQSEHLIVLDFKGIVTSYLSDSSNRTIIEKLATYGALSTMLSTLAGIFGPSLEETQDLTSPAHQMRKLFLEKLVEELPDLAEEIWDLIRNQLERVYRDYKHIPGGKPDPYDVALLGRPLTEEESKKGKRWVRVTRVFEGVVKSRLAANFKIGLSDDTFARAEHLFNVLKKPIEFPDFKTMCLAFGVEYPSAT